MMDSMKPVFPSEKCLTRLTSENIASVLGRYDTFLLDCDGVLWENATFGKFDGIKETVEKLRSMGKHLIFISNNPRSSKESFQEKFQSLCGFTADGDDIMLVNDTLISYLRDEKGVKGNVYLFGSWQTRDALEAAGYPVVDFGQNPEPPVGDLNTGIVNLMRVKPKENVVAMVISNDGYFDYNKLFKAANYLCNPGCAFVATGDEPRDVLDAPDGRKLIVPTTGSLLAAVEAASGRKADVIGKPSPYYFQSVKKIHPIVDPARSVMIGDILVSDITLAANCGMDSILVCTGVDSEETTKEAFRKNPDVALPTYIIDGFADIGKFLSWVNQIIGKSLISCGESSELLL